MTKPKTALLFLSILFFLVPHFASAYNVCTITINSSEEKEIFRRKLEPQGFTFHELVPTYPPNNSSPDSMHWMDLACQRGIRCDILLLSGHFALSFFGASGYDLPLEKMEELSCSQKCDHVFRSPLEVFLFGCNTLAGKEKDTRTPEEYRRVLLADGITPMRAEEAVTLRYSPLGNANGERMQRVFASVPRIYGYSSKSPLGKDNRRLVEKWFQTIPNYPAHLQRLQQEKSATLMNSRNPGEILSSPWLDVMKGISPSVCGGSSIQDPQLQLVCRIHSPQTTSVEKLTALRDLLSAAEGRKYLLVAQQFLKGYNNRIWGPAESRILQQITNNFLLRKMVMDMIPLFENAMNTRMQLIELALYLNWIDERETGRLIVEPIKNLFSQPVTADNIDKICHFGWYSSTKKQHRFPEIPANEIHPLNFTTLLGLKALACERAAHPTVVEKIFSLAQNPNSGLYLQLLDTLGMSETRDPRVQQFYYQLLFSPDPWVAHAALLGVYRTHHFTPQVIAKVNELQYDSRNPVRVQAEHIYKLIQRDLSNP